MYLYVRFQVVTILLIILLPNCWRKIFVIFFNYFNAYFIDVRDSTRRFLIGFLFMDMYNYTPTPSDQTQVYVSSVLLNRLLMQINKTQVSDFATALNGDYPL